MCVKSMQKLANSGQCRFLRPRWNGEGNTPAWGEEQNQKHNQRDRAKHLVHRARQGKTQHSQQKWKQTGRRRGQKGTQRKGWLRASDGSGQVIQISGCEGKWAWCSHGARCMVRAGVGIPQITGKDLVTVSAGENQRSEQKEIWSLVPALPRNTQVSLNKSLPFPRKEFPHL